MWLCWNKAIIQWEYVLVLSEDDRKMVSYCLAILFQHYSHNFIPVINIMLIQMYHRPGLYLLSKHLVRYIAARTPSEISPIAIQCVTATSESEFLREQGEGASVHQAIKSTALLKDFIRSIWTNKTFEPQRCHNVAPVIHFIDQGTNYCTGKAKSRRSIDDQACKVNQNYPCKT